ncbi:PAAR domain-containing protein [uncultured Tateyamaria sp.]|uniref:PAAR domain-containing protein n=1 Tax=Tateyamaria sp. 1078 TaxID=3417464 RepID=UPI002633D000|nr:PAAR domain-containing protein [uncultured Tateyamaria sp.]
MSGKPAARLGDIGSGHGCHFPPSPAIQGSPNVLINNRPAVRVTDAYLPHPCPVCPQPPHPRNLAKGSPTVQINNLMAGRVGDAISCGGNHAVGSPNVLIGGASPPGRTRAPTCESCEDKASKG